MEKYARQAINDGVTSTEELSITRDCELYRALNMHYNKANDFEVRTDLFIPPPPLGLWIIGGRETTTAFHSIFICLFIGYSSSRVLMKWIHKDKSN